MSPSDSKVETEQASWSFADVERVRESDPEFFVHPLPGVEDRGTIVVGELVKVVVTATIGGSEEIYGRWMVVDQVVSPNRIVAYLHRGHARQSKPPCDPGKPYEFGIENVYRIPPREFTLWGVDKIPNTINGGTSRPELSDGRLKPDCPESVYHFTANGWEAAKQRYVELQASRPEWPSLEELVG